MNKLWMFVSKNKKLLSLVLVLIILLVGSSYAWLSLTLNSTNSNIVKAGTLSVKLDDNAANGINIEKAIAITEDEGFLLEPYTFTITNDGDLGSNFEVYLDDLALSDGQTRIDDKYVRYSLVQESDELNSHLLSDSGVNTKRIIYTDSIAPGKTKTFSLRIWIDYAATNEAMNKYFNAGIRVEAFQKNRRFNVKAAYNYDETNEETKCITGEESTCVSTECYMDSSVGSCPVGTIIKYAVNNTKQKYFYVLHDDGDTMTLQQRENTVSNVAWYGDANDNTKGPLTILPKLEEATANWTNVKDQTYTMGTTTFLDNAYTGCANNGTNISCTTNSYILPSKTTKARMITIQEAVATGCKVYQIDGSTSGTCPDFMHNYLYEAINYGASINDTNLQTSACRYDWSYVTMNATLTNSTDGAFWLISRVGALSTDYTTSGCEGARAVIVISK